MKKKVKKGLCYRCEHRARAMEGQIPAKKQCARDRRAVMKCDRYLPIVPVATGRLMSSKEDPRPRFIGILSCREQAVGLPTIETLEMGEVKVKGGEVWLWIPCGIDHPEGSSELEEHHSLCWRCDHRACNRETGWQPRMECGEASSKWACYMYRPTRPCVVKLKRDVVTCKSQHASMLLPNVRSEYRGVPELKLTITQVGPKKAKAIVQSYKGVK